MDIKVGDTLLMKKKHPCGSNLWEVLRIGADFRIQCCGCGHLVMLPRTKLEKNIKSIERKENTFQNKSDAQSYNDIQNHPNKSQVEVGNNIIILADNRKCVYETHLLKDITAIIRIVKPNGEIINYELPAAYCTSCNLYFALKSDYKNAKKLGSILCIIKDQTQQHLIKIHNQNTTGKESKIHQLGYNVIRNNGYTEQQRHIILANIIENTDISKYEIKMNIAMNIARHKNQSSYSQSVNCWINDLEFVNNYQIGDIPQVKIDNIIIGKRQ